MPRAFTDDREQGADERVLPVAQSQQIAARIRQKVTLIISDEGGYRLKNS